MLPDAAGEALPTSRADTVLVVSRRAITRGLWLIVLAILVIGIAQFLFESVVADTALAKYSTLLALDAELSLPAWFSSIMLIGAAGLCFFASRCARVRDPANRTAWFALSLIFVYLSFDEAGSIHERISWEVQRAFDLRGVFYFAWVLVAAPLIVILLIFLRQFLIRLPSPIGRRVFLAGAVFVTGALGFEMLASVMAEEGMDGVLVWLENVAEEGLEMAGVVLFIGAILDYVALTSRNVTLTFPPLAPVSVSVRAS